MTRGLPQLTWACSPQVSGERSRSSQPVSSVSPVGHRGRLLSGGCGKPKGSVPGVEREETRSLDQVWNSS